MKKIIFLFFALFIYCLSTSDVALPYDDARENSGSPLLEPDISCNKKAGIDCRRSKRKNDADRKEPWLCVERCCVRYCPDYDYGSCYCGNYYNNYEPFEVLRLGDWVYRPKREK